MDRIAQESQEIGAWDFVLLDPLTEESFIENLSHRYRKDQIYTYIGNELVSVNPYKRLNIYSSDLAKAYLKKGPFQLPPHIFSVVGSAYRWLRDSNEDHCIILSGESDSGKTETVKMALKFLTYVTSVTDTSVVEINNQILHAGYLLEAFGNATTFYNNNASRFGKYVEIDFDYKGDPISAAITTYILEKFRIVDCILGERNFHIFYQLLAGADVCLLKLLKLQRNASNYTLLHRNEDMCKHTSDDKNDFLLVKKCLEILCFTPEKIAQIYKLIATILKLGNLIFISTTNIDGTEGCSIMNDHELYEISELLETDVPNLRCALTSENVHPSCSSLPVISVELSAEDASYSRNRLCVSLYNRLFMWLVKTINTIIKRQPRGKYRVLSMLDMYGFETFDHNGFQQLVINFTNEKLQQVIVQNTLFLEQEEYLREGLNWTPIVYYSGSHICDLMEKNDGLFSLIDDACVRSGSIINETCLLKKICSLQLNTECHNYCNHTYHCFSYSSSTPLYISEDSPNCFRLRHFAGNVTYDVTDFVDKNREIIRKDVSAAMFRCAHPLLKVLFPEGDPTKLFYSKQPNTVTKQVKTGISTLLRNINNKRLHYVRCIKPNSLKQPCIIERGLVSQQMCYQNLLETVRIRRLGFCYYLPYEKFLNRYKMMSLHTWPFSKLPPVQAVQYIIRDVPIPAAEFAFGATKLFIRSPRSVYELEDFRRQRIGNLAAIIQNAWRTHYYSTRFLKMKQSQGIIASAWRRYKVRKRRSKYKREERIEWAAFVIQRRYQQWKRCQFLNNLILFMSPSMMSPINQDWPACSMRLIHLSALLRKLHHKWRCHRYRMRFNQTARNKMREKVTASILFKNRKCCYSDSVSKPFVGDYVRLKQNVQWKKVCTNENDQYIVFANTINKITRSSGKFLPALLIMSTNSVLIADHRTLEIKYRIPVREIYRLSVSPYIDDIAVFHIHPTDKILGSPDIDPDRWSFTSSSSTSVRAGCLFVNDGIHKKGDFILQTGCVVEVITKLFLVIQNAVGKPPELNISPEFNACFYQQIVTISFKYVRTSDVAPGQIKIVRKGDKLEVLL